MILGLIGALVVLGVCAVLFSPREPVVTDVVFDNTLLDGGVDSYLATAEAQFDDILDDVHKRVLWGDQPEQQTDWAVVYVHGFSATSAEVRPLPDLVAQGLGANLVFTRLTGHGRSDEAMAQAQVGDWMADLAEAIAIAQRIGRRVLVMGTSTGATLTTLALCEDMGQGVDRVAFVSPNFAIQDRAAVLLTWPGARWWGPVLAGRTREWEARNADHHYYWHTSYPMVSLLPMAAAVKAAQMVDAAQIRQPALFVFDPRDQVVNHQASAQMAERWGGGAHVHQVQCDGDEGCHVIAGDVLSPKMTAPLAAQVLQWMEDQDAAEA